MKQTLMKSEIMQNGYDIYTTYWLNLGIMIAGINRPKRYRMTDKQVRLVVLTMLNRNLLGV